MITIPNFVPDGKDPCMLVVSVGNTNTRFGWFEGRLLRATEAVPTASVVRAVPIVPAGWPVTVVSVVPAATEALARAWSAIRPRVLTAETAGLEIDYHPSGSLGADRLANAWALRERSWAPAIAIDCGTATTLTLVDTEGRVRGGAIAPGLGTSARALIGKTAQLRRVPFERPEGAWGRSTVESLQIGIVEGHVGMIHHLVERMRQGLGVPARAVLCGGWAGTVATGLRDYEHVPYLTLEGARAFGLSACDA